MMPPYMSVIVIPTKNSNSHKERLEKFETNLKKVLFDFFIKTFVKY